MIYPASNAFSGPYKKINRGLKDFLWKAIEREEYKLSKIKELKYR